MQSNTDAWREAKRKIIEATDWRSVYSVEYGLKTIGEENENGWIECHAYGRTDNDASAGFNVKSGSYKDHGGDGLSVGPFDFAVHIGKFSDWKEARREFAQRAGVKLPKGTEPARPEDKLTFKPWNELLVLSWCDKKPPIAPTAIQAAGGRIASWPTTGTYSVIAFPIFGPQLLAADPIGYTLYNLTGGTLKDGNGDPRKMLLAPGSKKGWLGLQGLERLADAAVVWKCEGTTDLLAVMTAMQAAGVEDHAVISNSHGSTEQPQDELCAALTGKVVNVIHDADKSGENGAKKWAAAIARHAREVRQVRLPYRIKESGGNDVRDWLAGKVEEVAA